MGGLRAGVARRVISPPRGVFLVGYGDRNLGNRGVADDVTATALVLDDGTCRAAIVSADLLTICERTVDRISARVATQVGDCDVLICCSHTHSGPISYADDRSARRDRDYVDLLVDRIAAAVGEAAGDLHSAHLEWSIGRCELAHNRRERTPGGKIEIGRNPDGVCDRSVGVLGVVADDVGSGRRRLATVVGYACHGTVLGPRTRMVSADWIGAMRRRVEADLGGSVLFCQGASGNVNPDVSWEVDDPFGEVERAGAMVADAVLDAVAGGVMPLASTPLRVDRRDVSVPLQAEADSPEPPRSYVEPLLAMAGLPRLAAPLGEPLLRRRYPWRPTVEARDGRWAVPMRHSVLRAGELALVSYGAETFTEIGLAAKAASPATATIFSSVTDGCISYLATADAHREGGYEVDVAPWAYRYPARLDPSGEALALAATTEAFGRLWP